MNKLFLTLALVGLMAAPQMHAAFSGNKKYALAAVAGTAAVIGVARIYKYVWLSDLITEKDSVMLVGNNGWLTVENKKQVHFINRVYNQVLTRREQGTYYPCHIGSRLPEKHIQCFQEYITERRRELEGFVVIRSMEKVLERGVLTAFAGFIHLYNFFTPA